MHVPSLSTCRIRLIDSSWPSPAASALTSTHSADDSQIEPGVLATIIENPCFVLLCFSRYEKGWGWSAWNCFTFWINGFVGGSLHSQAGDTFVTLNFLWLAKIKNFIWLWLNRAVRRRKSLTVDRCLNLESWGCNNFSFKWKIRLMGLKINWFIQVCQSLTCKKPPGWTPLL